MSFGEELRICPGLARCNDPNSSLLMAVVALTLDQRHGSLDLSLSGRPVTTLIWGQRLLRRNCDGFHSAGVAGHQSQRPSQSPPSFFSSPSSLSSAPAGRLREDDPAWLLRNLLTPLTPTFHKCWSMHVINTWPT